MRICDRCKKPDVREILRKTVNGSEIDLCGQCLTEFDVWLAPKPEPEPVKRGPGRPKGT